MPEVGLTSSVQLMREESFVNSTRAFCMASSDSVTLNDTMRLFNVVCIIVSPAARSNFFPMFGCIRCKKCCASLAQISLSHALICSMVFLCFRINSLCVRNRTLPIMTEADFAHSSSKNAAFWRSFLFAKIFKSGVSVLFFFFQSNLFRRAWFSVHSQR